MSIAIETNADWAVGLGEPATLWNEARAKPSAGSVAFRANAHLHLPPNFSAFSSVDQALQLAQDQSVAVVGASNYYDYTVYRTFGTKARASGVYPLFGLEIITLDTELASANIKVNDPGNPGRMYICGKGIVHFAPMASTAAHLLETIRNRDAERMAQMTNRLALLFADAGLETNLTADVLKAQFARRYGCPPETVFLQERHLALAFQEAVFAALSPAERSPFWNRLFSAPVKAASDDATGVQNEIRSHVMKAGKPAYITETFVDFDHAIRLILALGGIPCYPTLLDGANPICPFEAPLEDFISRLRERNLFCAELIPLRNRPEILREYVRAMRSAGLIVTAGTEHNTPEMVGLTPTCLGGEPIPDDIASIFREGACVVAAHQYLTAHGEPGYVNSEGVLNPSFADSDERIDTFHRLGEVILQRYQGPQN